MKKVIYLFLILLIVACKTNQKPSVKEKDNKNVDTLILKSQNYGELTIYINKPNFYNIVKTRKFQPIYFFSNEEKVFLDIINSSNNTSTSSESFIYVLVKTNKNKKKYSTAFSFLENELFPLIESKYKCFPNRYMVGDSKNAEIISEIIINDINSFDFYLFIHPNFKSVNRLNELNQHTINTQKSINFILSEKGINTLISKNELLLINNEVLNGEIQEKTQSTNELKKSIFKLINRYNRKIGDIEKEFILNDFEKGDSIITILNNYSKLNKKLLSPRNTNELAYTAQMMGNKDLSIKLIEWAIELFPNSLNLYHSKGELYEKNNDFENSKKAYDEFKNVIIKNKNGLKSSSYEYYLKLYKKSIERLN